MRVVVAYNDLHAVGPLDGVAALAGARSDPVLLLAVDSGGNGVLVAQHCLVGVEDAVAVGALAVFVLAVAVLRWLVLVVELFNI